MRQSLLLFLIILTFSSCKKEVDYTGDQLINTINAYRVENGLSKIPVSVSLNKVATIHVADLIAYHVPNGPCNLHSWSKNGKWKSCCYDDDHSNSACMWNKPRELTNYKGDGYEIAVFCSDGISPELALSLWKTSPGHHNMIMNRGKWKKVKWKAIGAEIKGNYAVVWFGRESDKTKSKK